MIVFFRRFARLLLSTSMVSMIFARSCHSATLITAATPIYPSLMKMGKNFHNYRWQAILYFRFRLCDRLLKK